jgi:hypothetical protein
LLLYRWAAKGRGLTLTRRVPSRRTWLALAGTGGLALLTFALLAGRRAQRTDEAWFLWVTDRLSHGQVLYRDVYAVTTPVSFWIGLAAVKVAGAELLVIRALSVACFVASVELARRLAKRRGVGGPGQVLIIGTIFVLGSPASHAIALYSGMAIALAIASWYVLDGPGGMRPRQRLVIVGVLTGLCFQTKPNVGILALLAVIAAVTLPRQSPAGGSRPSYDAAIVVGGFAASAGAVLAVVGATGGLHGYVDYVFLNKADYLHAGVTYVNQLGDAARIAAGFGTSRALSDRVLTAVMLLPLAATTALAAAFIRARRTVGALLLPAAFTAVGLAALVPRATPGHVAAAAPLLVTGPSIAWRVGHPAGPNVPWSRLAAGTAAAGLAIGFGALVARSTQGLVGDHVPLRHFAAIPNDRRQATRLRSELRALRRATRGRVFIVKTDAGFLYLVGDLSDPVPFDIPERTDFGPGDENDAIRAIQRNHLAFVCLREGAVRESRPHPPLTPVKVERYVRHHFRVVSNYGTCRLYERPGRSSSQLHAQAAYDTGRAMP